MSSVWDKAKPRTTKSVTGAGAAIEQFLKDNAKHVRQIDIKISDLRVSPSNIYGFTEEEVMELASSIGTLGLLEGLIVEKMPDGKYDILSGQKRFLAIRSLQRNSPNLFEKWFPDQTIPCKAIDLEKAIFAGETLEQRFSVETKREYIITSGNIQHVKTVGDYMIAYRAKKHMYDEHKKMGLVETGVKRREYLAELIHLKPRSTQTLLSADTKISQELWFALERCDTLESISQLDKISQLDEAHQGELLSMIQSGVTMDFAEYFESLDAKEESAAEMGKLSVDDKPKSESRSMTSKDIEKYLGLNRLKKAVSGISDAKEIKESDMAKLKSVADTINRKIDTIEKVLKKYK